MTTLVGNIGGGAPELRLTPSGVSVGRFRMACTPRKRDGDKFVDGEPSWYTVNVWRDLAEHVAESLSNGDQVVVYGALSVRTYEKDGERRTSTEVEAYAVGVSLQFATAKPVKAVKGGGGRQQAAASDDPWGDTPATRSRPAQAATSPADAW